PVRRVQRIPPPPRPPPRAMSCEVVIRFRTSRNPRTWKRLRTPHGVSGKRAMRRLTRTLGPLALLLLILTSGVTAQTRRGARAGGEEFGPNVRAYLGYLRNEQEVVDDRVSRREIDRHYYVHNSNRIQALRQMALHI